MFLGLTVKVYLNPGYHLMLRQLLQMQGRNNLGLGKRLAGSVGWSSSCFISPCLEPLQAPSPARCGQVAVLCCWRAGVAGVSRAPEACQGWPCMEGWSCCRGEQPRGGRKRQGKDSSPEAGLPYWRRVGTGRVGQQGQIRVCFLSSHLPSNSYCLCTFLLRWPRVCFCFCISINDMANINQITLKGKREIQQCWRVSSPARQRIKSLNRRGLLQECFLFVFHTAMVYWQRTGGCSSIRREEV